MAAAVAGYFIYPGLPPLIGGEYTVSHGTSPGTIVLRTHPGTIAPVAGGAVIIGDNRKSFVVRGCKLIRFTADRSDSGNEWLLELEDGRWRWRDGKIDGCYNQLDPHGKLIPRMIRSPTELAILCLRAMGVQRFIVDMPDGIPANQFINNIPDFLPVGINFPPIGINPPVNWVAENPASALAQLADITGRRVVYDPVDDRVLVVRPGLGDALPNGSIHNLTPSATAPETPDGVQVVGDPTRYESFFELYAVGIEWDGSIRPISELSYAPVIPGSQHIVKYQVTKAVAGAEYGVTIEPDGANRAVDFSVAGSGTVSAIASAVAAAINASADPAIQGKIKATPTVDTVLIFGTAAGTLFDVVCANGSGYESVTIQKAGSKERRGWDFSPPPDFPNVKATDRLTRLQAVALAQKCIFRMYRLTGRDAGTLKAPINIPGYGNAERQDIVILDELCEQVVPDPGDKRFADRDGKPLIRTLYDGYSRSKPAEVYGSVCSSCVNSGDVWFIGSGPANAGAAAIGKGGAADPVLPAVAPEAREYTYEVKRQILGYGGNVYRIIVTEPGGATATASYTATGADTQASVVIGLVNAVNTSANLGGKLTASSTDVLVRVAGDPGLLFEMRTDNKSEIGAVVQVKSGSGGTRPADAPPVVFVSPSQKLTPPGDAKGNSLNTDPSDRVYVDFSVDPTWQTITFNSPVWFAGAGLRVEEPKLFLRAACHVRDRFTQQFAAYTDTKIFRPGPAVRIVKRPDVQLNVIGDFRIVRAKGAGDVTPGGAQYAWKLFNTRLLEADAVLRARYYLDAEILQFQLKGGLTIEYNGIEPIRMDGLTSQVTYRVEGGVGIMTTASQNLEHSTWVVPYPARRRAENLAAVARNEVAGGRVNPAANPYSRSGE